MSHGINDRVRNAREFLLRPTNAWIPGRDEALVELADGLPEAKLTHLESIGPMMVQHVKQEWAPEEGETYFESHHPLHHVLLYLMLMRQNRHPSMTVHWKNVCFRLDEDRLIATRAHFNSSA